MVDNTNISKQETFSKNKTATNKKKKKNQIKPMVILKAYYASALFFQTNQEWK